MSSSLCCAASIPLRNAVPGYPSPASRRLKFFSSSASCVSGHVNLGPLDGSGMGICAAPCKLAQCLSGLLVSWLHSVSHHPAGLADQLVAWGYVAVWGSACAELHAEVPRLAVCVLLCCPLAVLQGHQDGIPVCTRHTTRTKSTRMGCWHMGMLCLRASHFAQSPLTAACATAGAATGIWRHASFQLVRGESVLAWWRALTCVRDLNDFFSPCLPLPAIFLFKTEDWSSEPMPASPASPAAPCWVVGVVGCASLPMVASVLRVGGFWRAQLLMPAPTSAARV